MRFLIFGGPGIGDTVIEATFAKCLKKEFKDSMVDIIMSGSMGTTNVVVPVIECQNYIDNVYIYSKKDFIRTIKTIWRLKNNSYDYSFLCTTQFKTRNTPFFINRIIGGTLIHNTKKKCGIQVHTDNKSHFMEQFFSLIKPLKHECTIDNNIFDVSKLPAVLCGSKNNKLITICLGTNNTIYRRDNISIYKNIKEWNIEKWIELANVLLEKGYDVLFIGGRKELDAYETADVKISNNEVARFLGKTDVKESISILNCSELVIGADTGMMHCAAALGKRTLSLFGGTDPNNWRPYSDKNFVIYKALPCSPCYGRDHAIDCEDRNCMKSISICDVMRAIESIMV